MALAEVILKVGVGVVVVAVVVVAVAVVLFECLFVVAGAEALVVVGVVRPQWDPFGRPSE